VERVEHGESHTYKKNLAFEEKALCLSALVVTQIESENTSVA
jgi:hypothetical protein